MDENNPLVHTVAMKNGRFVAVGNAAHDMAKRASSTCTAARWCPA